LGICVKDQPRLFRIEQPLRRFSILGDAAAVALVIAVLYGCVRLALDAPSVIQGPSLSLDPAVLPFYAVLSTLRMMAAYGLSLAFSLVYGYMAATRRRAEKLMMPLLDVLQSVPILSFLPAVLLSFSAILPEALAAEAASIVLIFTSQVWNLTFAWYQSLTTIPKELREASSAFGFDFWLRLKTLELPFAAISLVWNSMMSWAGGWFFLMAAEIFTVGDRDFRLVGLGAYLHEAAVQGNVAALGWGIGALGFVIAALDQLLWRPLLAWSHRFKMEMLEGERPPSSWWYEALRSSRLLDTFRRGAWEPFSRRLDAGFHRQIPASEQQALASDWISPLVYPVLAVAGAVPVYFAYRAAGMLAAVPPVQWAAIGQGLLLTGLRVSAALVFALAWTLPLGVAIGASSRIAGWLQPVVQVAASVPATALFPALLLLLLDLPGGLDLAAVLLMLMGAQWYLLFNVIAGAATIPVDLRYTCALLGLSRWERWRTLVLPALFPFVVTGAITAAGGAWNASVVAEYVHFGGRTVKTVGLGSLIAEATAEGDFPLLLAATLTMVLAVVALNRLVWRPLYRLAEERFRLE
jgi:NitT/TauT family transport system permease protein